ncbi:unnamed protein product [Paramecium sonneborni]|uniref:Uncharacterized protein n=1 Tax=Paramecium sonneborni TaxID=65129 RepID=A0A8S1N8X2_9CILI|nr:unnamed protein product [Paramecium sonneborni]
MLFYKIAQKRYEMLIRYIYKQKYFKISDFRFQISYQKLQFKYRCESQQKNYKLHLQKSLECILSQFIISLEINQETKIWLFIQRSTKKQMKNEQVCYEQLRKKRQELQMNQEIKQININVPKIKPNPSFLGQYAYKLDLVSNLKYKLQ